MRFSVMLVLFLAAMIVRAGEEWALLRIQTPAQMKVWSTCLTITLEGMRGVTLGAV